MPNFACDSLDANSEKQLAVGQACIKAVFTSNSMPDEYVTSAFCNTGVIRTS
jgi:hypothetical protein